MAAAAGLWVCSPEDEIRRNALRAAALGEFEAYVANFDRIYSAESLNAPVAAAMEAMILAGNPENPLEGIFATVDDATKKKSISPELVRMLRDYQSKIAPYSESVAVSSLSLVNALQKLLTNIEALPKA
jgi:hypothetical protein